MAADPQMWQKGANGSANFKYNIEIENKATIDHL